MILLKYEQKNILYFLFLFLFLGETISYSVDFSKTQNALNLKSYCVDNEFKCAYALSYNANAQNNIYHTFDKNYFISHLPSNQASGAKTITLLSNLNQDLNNTVQFSDKWSEEFRKEVSVKFLLSENMPYLIFLLNKSNSINNVLLLLLEKNDQSILQYFILEKMKIENDFKRENSKEIKKMLKLKEIR